MAATKPVRYYTVMSTSLGEIGGRYASKSGPFAAAKKAANKRFSGDKTEMRLTIRETGTKNEFTYDAKRVQLSTPVVRKVGDTQITSKFKTDLKAVKKSELGASAPATKKKVGGGAAATKKTAAATKGKPRGKKVMGGGDMAPEPVAAA